MTKLVVVLAVVIVVILVVVIVAVRNMRAEDPGEFSDRPGGRGGMRDGRDERDPRYDRPEPAGRHPARGSTRGGRPGARPSGNARRPAGASARGFDERRDHRGRGYDQQPQDGRGYDDDRRFDQQRGPDDRRGAQPATAREDRRRGNGAQRRPEESQPPARTRSARARRSDDSSQWDSSEWDKLSDVDYWAELASDKPLTTTAQPAQPAPSPAPPRPAASARNATQPRNGRPRPERDAETPVGRGAGRGGSVPGGSIPGGPVPGGGVPNGAPRRDPATGLPIRGRAAAAGGDLAAAGRTADFAAAPVPVNGSQDPLRPLTEPHPSLPRHAGPASLPGPVHGIPQDRPVSPPAPLDDDPLTSPGFPRVPDSRSYRNGRANTPHRDSRAPDQYLAPTQQFSSYGEPAAPPPAAPQRPAAPRHTGPQHPAAQHRADVGGETERTNPNAYRPDPLTSRDPYAPRSASLPPTPMPPTPMPQPPAPSGHATAGNPYGSYVTPDSQAPTGYGDYPAASGNGHGSYLPPANGGAHAGNGNGYPNGGAHAGNGNGYWQGQAPGNYSGANGTGHLNGSAPASDPRENRQAAEYRNGYGRHGQPGYPPDGYSAGPDDQAGYAPADPYAGDEYGGYPGYGGAGR